MAMYDPQEEQILGLREQKAFARKLREEAMNAPQGQMVSGWYVKPSITQYLAQGLKGYLGGQEQAQAEQGLQDIRGQQQRGREAFLSNMPQPTSTQVEDRSGMNPMMRGPSPASKTMTVNPTMEQMLGWAATAPNLDTGTIAQLALKGVESKEAIQERTRQAETARAEKMAFEERQNQLNREGRLDQARLAASLRPAPQEKPLTEFQGKSSTFGTRAAQSHNILNSLEETVNPLAVTASQKGGMLTNWALAPETQKVAQAQTDFINAVLRQESGAAIGQSEFDNARRQYFPQAGDSPEVIAQKRSNRELVVKGFARQAGPAGRDIAEVYNAGAPVLATPNNTNMPSPNSIAAEIARRAQARGQ